MALKKTIVQPNGVETGYHKVSQVSVTCESDSILMRVELTSYLDEDYRKAGLPIIRSSHHFDVTSEEEESTSVRKLAYAKIKTLENWSDAEDC